MLKSTAVIAAAVAMFLALGAPKKAPSPSGSWQVDPRLSDAQLTTDATTDFGRTQTNFTIGFARVNGFVKLDAANPANSQFDFRIYPASSMAPPIDEEGKVKIEWFANLANNTLVCFHSKGAQKTADGRFQTTGNLVLTRVDRNVELTPNEAYAGPVYGPPVIHRVIRQATFAFDSPADAEAEKDGSVRLEGSTNVVREDFPQLLKAVVATYWPPVVQEKHCQTSNAGGQEGYRGSQCTGTFLETPTLPAAPSAGPSEDYPGPAGFNAVVGRHLNVAIRFHLAPAVSLAHTAAGN
jgi:polyisoprenoid-binding protein YceI